MKTNQTKKVVIVGLLIALAYVSLYYIRIPIIPSASFLRLDVKDVFIAMVGLFFGPIYAFASAICISLLQMISVSEYGVIGLAMNILSVSSFVIPVAIIYKNKQNNFGLASGLFFSCITMIVTMLLWNYLISPLYMGVTREVIKRMLIPVFLPFNAIKSAVNALVVYILFTYMKKAGIIRKFVEKDSRDIKRESDCNVSTSVWKEV